MNTPVLMIVFCRPESTRKVFEEVRKAKPTRLYVSCDAPLDKEGARKQEEVLNIFKRIDWDCQLNIYRQKENQGCSLGPYKAISWFFEHEEEGIILEDDILPSPDFFLFCEEMLERYRDNGQILSISGWNYFYHGVSTDYKYSYYFSRFSSSWGWATWRRAWINTDIKLSGISRDRFLYLLNKFGFNQETRRYYLYIFNKIKRQFDSLKSWDYQFTFSAWNKEMLVIQPMRNLTENIGIGEGATHEMPTVILHNKWQTLYPLKYPCNITVNMDLDAVRIAEEKLYRYNIIKRLIHRIFQKLKKLS